MTNPNESPQYPPAVTPDAEQIKVGGIDYVDRYLGEDPRKLRNDESAREQLVKKAHEAAIEEDKQRQASLTDQARQLLEPSSPITPAERARLEKAVSEASQHFVELSQMVKQLDTEYPRVTQPELAKPTIDLSDHDDVKDFVEELQEKLKKVPTDALLSLIKNGAEMNSFAPENFNFKLPKSLSGVTTTAGGETSRLDDLLSPVHSLVANALNELYQRYITEFAFPKSGTRVEPGNHATTLKELAEISKEMGLNKSLQFDQKFRAALQETYGGHIPANLSNMELSLAKKILGMEYISESDLSGQLKDVDPVRSERILTAIRATLTDVNLGYMLDKWLVKNTKEVNIYYFTGTLATVWEKTLTGIAQHFDAINAAQTQAKSSET